MPKLILDTDILDAAEMPDLDDACRHIQNVLEVHDGGIAAQVFSDFEWNAEAIPNRMRKLREYIAIESGPGEDEVAP